jgi:transporter family-2 protein
MMVGAGLLMSFQGPINAALRTNVGVYESALVSFTVGTLALLLVVAFAGQGKLSASFQVPPWQLLGGLIGAVFVTTSLVATPKIGVAGMIAAALAGQMLGALAIDRAGWFSLAPRGLTPWRVAGVALLGLGVWFLNFKEAKP